MDLSTFPLAYSTRHNLTRFGGRRLTAQWIATQVKGMISSNEYDVCVSARTVLLQLGGILTNCLVETLQLGNKPLAEAMLTQLYVTK